MGVIVLVPSEFRLSKPLAVRLFGFVVLAGGLAVVGAGVLAGLLDLPDWAVPATVTVVVCALLGAAVVLARLAPVVLDAIGYRVRLVRGVGVAQARWTDVEDVVATTAAGERCVVLRLRDGRTSTIPVRVLAVDPDDFVRDLQEHLDRGHGYRRLR